MDEPHPRVVVAVNPPLLAEALGRVLQRQHGDTVQVTSPGHDAVEVVALGGDPDVAADYVLSLPDRPGEPAVLLAPDGRSTALVLHDVADVTDLVREVLRRG